MKERLTGAMILVALLVLLVPELLSGPGQAAATNHPVSADGPPMRSYTIDLADDAAARRSSSAPVAETPMPAAPDAKPVVEATANDAQPARAAESVQGADRVNTEGGTASADRAPSAPAVKPAPAVKNEPPARPAPAPARVAAAEKPSDGGWAVQVGSFASRENAERLARELKGKSFESHVSESSGKGKRLWRVRVGPAPDRDSAEALRTRLRAAGQAGSVVPMP